MDIFASLMQGFGTVLTPYNLWMATVGCFFGTIVGILPGLGPGATIAILLPLTFGMNATSAMIMMTSIYYGAKYGGSTTSILVNVPGEGASVVTTFDGYATKPIPSGPINLGVHEPKDGKYVLRAEVIGTNPASTGLRYFFGLDAVVLEKP